MSQVEDVAKSLRKAMKGIGTDEKRLIKEIVGISNHQRQLVKDAFMTMYGKKLEEDIKSEISGDFQDTILSLLEEKGEYEAHMLRRAIKGIGTDEKVVIELLCTKEAHEIEKLKADYKKRYDRDLESDLENEERGFLGRIFRSVASGGRSDNYVVDDDLAQKEAQDLYDAGEGKFGTDESEFIRILCSRSFPQLRATFEHYQRISGHDINKAIKKEMGGDLEHACTCIATSAMSKPLYFAKALSKSMKGIGTKEKDLIRILVSRSEVDLPAIKSQFQSLYGKSLYDAVKSETRGDFEKVLLAIIGK